MGGRPFLIGVSRRNELNKISRDERVSTCCTEDLFSLAAASALQFLAFQRSGDVSEWNRPAGRPATKVFSLTFMGARRRATDFADA